MKQETNKVLKALIQEKLPIIRCSLGVSRQQIADCIGTNLTRYYRWETGEACPDILSLKTVVTDCFQISLDDFLNEHISADALVYAWRNSGNTFVMPLEKRQPHNNTQEAKSIIKNRLPLLRKANGMSRQAVAELIEIDPKVYADWEKGRCCLDALMLKKIVTDVLHFSLDDFLNETMPIEELMPLQTNTELREKALKMLIKKKLPTLRKSSKISQEKMAAYLGVSKSIYASWEKGNELVDALTLKKIVDIFHISLDEFLDEAVPIRTSLSLQSENGMTPSLLNSYEQNIIMHFRQLAIQQKK